MASLKVRVRKKKQDILRSIFGSLYRPGHFYSTIPNEQDYAGKLDQLIDKATLELPGIDLNLKGQKAFLDEALSFYKDIPFPQNKTEGFNYYYKNIYFVAPDAVALYLVLRSFNPKRVIEVGSGFSSAVIIDTNEKFFNGQTKCQFIEPFPDRLNWFLSQSQNSNYELLEKKVQDVPLAVFATLEAGDLLLIDSSHVSKLGSDVNYLFFNRLCYLITLWNLSIKPCIYIFRHL